ISRRPPRFANRMPVPKPRSANVSVEMRVDAGFSEGMLGEGATLWTGATCGAGAVLCGDVILCVVAGDATRRTGGVMLCVVRGAPTRGAGGVKLWACALAAVCASPRASKAERTGRVELSRSNRIDMAIT